MSIFRSQLSSLAVHRSGRIWLPSGTEITRLPIWDRAEDIAARVGPGPMAGWLAGQGMRLPNVPELDELRALSLHIEPYTLPTVAMLRAAGIPLGNVEAIDSFRDLHMSSLEWCRLHDAEVWRRLAEAGWTDEAVANFGKHWAAPHTIYGWWRTGKRMIQTAYTGHGLHHVGYGSTSHGVRLSSSETRPPSGTGTRPPGVLLPPDSGATPPRLTRPGERGPDVERWQRWLLTHGFDLPRYDADGQHGAETEAATAAWLAEHGFERGDEPEPDTERAPQAGPPVTDEWIESRNYTKAVRELEAVRLIVLHSMEGGTARSVARWFNGPSAPPASAHYCVGPGVVIGCVPLEHAAWTAPGANADGVQIEQEGHAMKTDWLGEGRPTVERTARLCAELCAYMPWIPPRRVEAAGVVGGEHGITTHAAVTEAYRKSSHVDPGGPGDRRWPWAEFLAMVRG